MADYERVAWQGVEVVTTADDDVARVSWQGVEVVSTSDVSLARASWVGAEILSTGTESWERASWVGLEVLMTFPPDPVNSTQTLQGQKQSVRPKLQGRALLSTYGQKKNIL